MLLAGACAIGPANQATGSSSPGTTATVAGAAGPAVMPPLVTDPSGPVRVPVTGDLAGVHDPVLQHEGGTYYLYYSHGGIHTLTSTDLVHWTKGPDAMAHEPGWVRAALPQSAVDDLWAPDLSWWGGQWHLYYAVSTWNASPTRNSAVGYATSPTLDPEAAGYGWVDHGPVVTSAGTIINPDRTDGWNAIDPNVTLDDKGRPWLVWGSAFDGIFIQPLGDDGHLAAGSAPTNLARRGAYFSVVEGAYLVHHDGAWWLFASYDLCCLGTKSNYKVMVGRADSITGPYVDKNGQSLVSPRDNRPLDQDAGTKVIAGYDNVYGPGHEAVLHDGDNWWLVHHWYNPKTQYSPTQAGGPELGIRPLDWGADGWPIARGWNPGIPPPAPF